MAELLYLDYHIPLAMHEFMQHLLAGLDPHEPHRRYLDTTQRQWFSQPRQGRDTTVEVVTVNFKLPMSVSELGFEVLRVPCRVEVLYQDRNNNWRPMLDHSRLPVLVNVSGSGSLSWYKHQTRIYPLVAKAVRFQITRSPDPATLDQSFVVALKNTLIRRNVYDRAQGATYLEDEQDAIGNVWTKYIKDWSADKAADSDAYTFWKCAPQPDPAAVVSLYLDTRDEAGNARTIDRLWIDPVYSGQHLNIYHTTDETQGALKLNPITIWPTDDINTEWRQGRGRTDVAPGTDPSEYCWPIKVGPMVEQPMWFGVEWAPGFGSISGPPDNPVLLRSGVQAGVGTVGWHPGMFYDVGAGQFVLRFGNGLDVIDYRAVLTKPFSSTDVVTVVAGWRYGPDEIHISVINRLGEVICELDGAPTDLPHLVSLDNELGMYSFRGTMTATVVMREDWARSSASFETNAMSYVSPDPVLPDADGRIPSTTLDNALYSADWTNQEHGSGGADESHFADKEWTPVWRDFVTEKAMLFFPQAVVAKWLKLEFSQLTQEPYPIYDSGIEVRYKVFPISVLKQSSIGLRVYTGEGGFVGAEAFINNIGIRSVNWLNPQSVTTAIDAVFGRTTEPVRVDAGPGYVTDSIPHTADASVYDSYSIELGSSYVYRREPVSSYVLAQNQYNIIAKAEAVMKIADYTDVPREDIAAANGAPLSSRAVTGALPVRGSDWWVFPGATLRAPANVMIKLTDTSTITERGLTLEHRVRWNTTAIHRYEYKTLRRDAGVAYFAGVREVFPLATTYLDYQDAPYFEFGAYQPGPDLWLLNNIRQTSAGPVTTAAAHYQVANPFFDRDLTNWTEEKGDWDWRSGVDVGHWHPGTAHVTADGDRKLLTSTKTSAQAGDGITASVWIRWTGATVADGTPGFGLLLSGYDAADEWVSDIAAGQVQFANWSTHADSTWVQVVATGTVPAGVDNVRLRQLVTDTATTGEVWFDGNLIYYTDPADAQGTLYKGFVTQSDFHRVHLDLRDSGPVRSNGMWADMDPLDDTNVPNDLLAYYVDTIPGDLPSGFWSDMQSSWGDTAVAWGEPHAVVSISIDGDRVYQGHRVLHFHRDAGTGEAGIKIRQWTNYVRDGLVRMGAVYFKPLADDNQLTMRLRRVSDGVYVHEETFRPEVGRWVEHITQFVELPDTDDHVYTVEFTLAGDDEDELYLSDLYTEVSHIRYYVQLGGIGQPLIEVTDMRAADSVNVVATLPVNEVALTVQILSNKAFAFGCRIVPSYLK